MTWPTGAKGIWRLNGDLLDTSGNGHNGAQNVGGTFVAAKLNDGYQGDGVDDRWSVASHADFDVPLNGAFSLVLWWKKNGFSGDGNNYIFHKTGGANGIIILQSSDSKINVRAGNSLGNYISTTAYADSNFHLIILERATDGTVKLTIDNVEEVNVDDGSAEAVIGSTLRFMSHNDLGSFVANGIMDQAAWWSRTLTPTEKSNLWNDGAGVEDSGVTNNDPDAPANLIQRNAADTANVATGEKIAGTAIKLRADVSDPDGGDTTKLQIEVRPVGTAFTNTFTHESSLGTNARTVTIDVTGLTRGTAYHWQARTVDNSDAASAWVSYGGNLETDEDFRINALPTIGSVAIAVVGGGSPTTNKILQANLTGRSDADAGDPTQDRYLWEKQVGGVGGFTTVKDAQIHLDATAHQLDLSVAGNGDVNDVIRVTVTPKDGQEDGSTVNASQTVSNTAPVLGALPAPTIKENVNSAAINLPASDADGGAHITGFTLPNIATEVPNFTLVSNTLNAAAGNNRDADVVLKAGISDAQVAAYTITVRVTDDSGAFAEGTMNVTVANDAPVMGSISNVSVEEGQSIVVNLGTTDVNGHDVIHRISRVESAPGMEHGSPPAWVTNPVFDNVAKTATFSPPIGEDGNNYIIFIEPRDGASF